MASHQIAIAKASFSAGLLRPDPTSVPRDEITAFHSSLDRALSHCSPANVQTCKDWLLHFVASSSNRVGGLAKYLAALARSIDEAPPKPEDSHLKSSAKRRRLHILYLLNDLFHHTKYHLNTTATFSTVSGSMQPFMVDLVGHAASYDQQKHPRHHRRLNDLLEVWSDNGYFSAELIHKLREVVKNGAAAGASLSFDDSLTEETDTARTGHGKDTPFILPSTHGDPTTPYYDLPAGNLIPHIIPNSTLPLQAEGIKPLQFQAGPADGALVEALKMFLKDVDQIYGREELVKDDENLDIDELGQRIVRDEITGDILDGQTYYGWSRTFCQQMKRDAPNDPRSHSRSRSASRNDLKRRRYSDSSASRDSRRPNSRSPSRSRRRSPSRESSYSPRESSPPRFPPPHHQYKPPPPPINHLPASQPASHSYNTQYAPLGPDIPPPPPLYPGAWPLAPSQTIAGLAHPSASPGVNPSAFPPPFSRQPAMPIPPGQRLPPGQYHFPPPHAGIQNGASWGHPGGRTWR